MSKRVKCHGALGRPWPSASGRSTGGPPAREAPPGEVSLSGGAFTLSGVPHDGHRP